MPGRIGRQNYARLEAMAASGATAPQIAAALNVEQETVRKYARKRGLQLVRHDADPTNHPCWNGGETVDKSGYVLVRVDRDGPHGYLIRSARRGDPRGYALKHRIRMHDHLGRQLLATEVVHHRDGDTLNNELSNLELFQSNADHLRETLAGKVPNWSPEGFAAMCAPRGPRRRKHLEP